MSPCPKRVTPVKHFDKITLKLVWIQHFIFLRNAPNEKAQWPGGPGKHKPIRLGSILLRDPLTRGRKPGPLQRVLGSLRVSSFGR